MNAAGGVRAVMARAWQVWQRIAAVAFEEQAKPDGRQGQKSQIRLTGRLSNVKILHIGAKRGRRNDLNTVLTGWRA